MNKVVARHMAGVQRLPYSVASSAKMGKITKILKSQLTKSNQPTNTSYRDDMEYSSNGSQFRDEQIELIQFNDQQAQ